MKKVVLLMFALTWFVAGFSQGKFISKNAYLSFYSSTPMEDILGESNEAVTILNGETGEIAFQALMTTFHFKRALMEEHFNENYMESTKFPKAKFSGKIEGFKKEMLTSPVTEVKVSGTLSLHGVDKQISIPAKLGVENGKLVGNAKFKVVPEDFKIDIPSLVRDKIGKEMEVTVKAEYQPYAQ